MVNSSGPYGDMRISQISALIPLEKLTHDLNHKSDTFWRIWEPLHSFLILNTTIHHLSLENKDCLPFHVFNVHAFYLSPVIFIIYFLYM